jgi:F0F1-type ATP synthase assembly protein I
MRKAAVKTTNIEELEQNLFALSAKRQFLAATTNMGFRLAVTVVIPIVAGVKIDERFNSSPSFTLLGMMIAVTAGCAAVWATIKQVNQEQAESSPSKPSRRIKRV